MEARAGSDPGDQPAPAAIADASALISLDRIGLLDLLRVPYSEVLVPSAVAGEVTSRMVLPTFVEERALQRPMNTVPAVAGLGHGEAEAIALAMEVGTAQIILADLPARRVAVRLGLSIIGTGGVIVAAKTAGLIGEARVHLDALRSVGFHLSTEMHDLLLRQVGE